MASDLLGVTQPGHKEEQGRTRRTTYTGKAPTAPPWAPLPPAVRVGDRQEQDQEEEEGEEEKRIKDDKRATNESSET